MQTIVTDDGEELPALDEGNGAAIVLLHEWTSSHSIWNPVARELVPNNRVIRWDARGHGGHCLRSQAPVTIARMADDLRCLLSHFDLDKPVIVGHSMGAIILWDYIRRFGCTDLSGVVIVDMTPRTVTDADWKWGIFEDWPFDRDRAFTESMRTDFVEALVTFARRGQAYRTGPNAKPPKGNFERLREMLAVLEPEPLIQIWQSIMIGDWRSVLPTIDVPALLVYGANSNFYSIQTGHYVADAIPGSVFKIYEGADHYPHLSDAGRFATDITEFVNTIRVP
ncbi:MAG: alpha/beta hydrolase [Hyphomicrobiales bacterium]|nr:alpha/beta hydrolase [Hyphomicrobiales bacterium]